MLRSNSLLKSLKNVPKLTALSLVLALPLIPVIGKQNQKPPNDIEAAPQSIYDDVSYPSLESPLCVPSDPEIHQTETAQQSHWWPPPPPPPFWDIYWPTVGLLFATAIAGIVALATLRDIKKQTRQITRIARSAKINAVSTAKQTEALLLGQRAWIIIDPVNISDDIPIDMHKGVLDVRPYIRNIGPTPAWPKRGSITHRLIANGEKLPPEPEYNSQIAEQEIYAIIPANSYVETLHEPIPHRTIIRAREGLGTLYVYGFIDYDDFAKQQRHTRFCLVYDVPKGADPQSRGWYVEINVPPAYIRFE